MSADTLKSNFRNALFENNYCLAMDLLCTLLEIDFEKHSQHVFSTKTKKNKRSGPLFIHNRDKQLIQAFWDSKVSGKFGYRLCRVPKKGEQFAQEAMKRNSIAVDIIRQGIASDSIGVLAMIKQRVLIKNTTLWESITEELSLSNNPEIQNFLEQSSILNSAYKAVFTEIKKYDSLLSKLKPETILVSYAIFLESLYFQAPNEKSFNIEKESYLPVLEKVLQRKKELTFQNKKKCKRGTQLSFSQNSLQRTFRDSIKKLMNNKPLDAFRIFEIYDKLIDIEFMMERLCLNDWSFNMDESTFTLAPTDPLQLTEWNRTNLKFHILHTFYDIYPFILNEQLAQEFEQTCFPNIESQQWAAQCYSFITFMMDYVGDGTLEYDGKKIDLERVYPNFSNFSACYNGQYCSPMRKRKNEWYHRLKNQPKSSVKNQPPTSVDVPVRHWC